MPVVFMAYCRPVLEPSRFLTKLLEEKPSWQKKLPTILENISLIFQKFPRRDHSRIIKFPFCGTNYFPEAYLSKKLFRR